MKILLAVSGGIDSMVMADMFASGRLESDALAVAHCNFHLRGEESDGDEALVRSWAAAHGIPLYVTQFDTTAVAVERSISIEMAARDLRYGWFAEICREHGYDAVAVAHHADDNAETLLLNLLRGTGGRGLCGMKENGFVPLAGDIVLLRPLLGLTRAEIEKYAAENGISFREDRTNTDTSFKRNLIRHEIFPLFEKINPSFRETFSREMEYFRDEWAIADEFFTAWAAENVHTSEEGLTIVSTDALLSSGHPSFILFRLLEPLGFNSAVLDEILSCIRSRLSGRTFLSPSGKEVVTASGHLEIRTSESDSRKPEFQTELIDWQEGMKIGEGMFDADKLPGELTIRQWREGDWMIPLGMNGRKKLSDIFSDAHLSLNRKKALHVIEFPGDRTGRVAAIIEMKRIDRDVRITDKTRRVLRLVSE